MASLAWNSSRYSSGTRPRSRNESIWPTFIAAPFIPPSTVTICSAVSIWRRSSALSERSCERTTLAAFVPVCRTATPAAVRPMRASRWTRPVGSFSSAMSAASSQPARGLGVDWPGSYGRVVKGSPVRNRRGPATVTGDEVSHASSHWKAQADREGATPKAGSQETCPRQPIQPLEERVAHVSNSTRWR